MTSLEAWSRIADWHRTNVPSKETRLPDGVSAQELSIAETSLGVVLPSDVREIYLRHDGSGDGGLFPRGYDLMPIKRVVSDWVMLSSVDQAQQPDSSPPQVEPGIKSQWWNKSWVPLTGNGGGDHHCIDFDPGDGGVSGQLIRYSHEVGPLRVVALTFTEWLVQLANDLANGKYRFDEYDNWLVPA